jgi:hypothetical protein
LRIWTSAVGAGLGKTRVPVTAHVIPWPTVETILLDRSYIVGNKMVAEIIALIGGTP